MKTTILLTVLLGLIAVVTYSNGAKILAVTPFPGTSHYIFISSILKSLAAKGHEVTFYSSITSGKQVKNVKEIKLNNTLDESFRKSFDFKFITQEMSTSPIFSFPTFMFMSLAITHLSLNDPVLNELIRSNETYDLVLLETHFGQEVFVALGFKFQAPVISLHTSATSFCVDEYLGNPLGIAYIPTFELTYSSKMTFFQRVHNAWRTFIFMFMTHLYYLPKQDNYMRTYFKFPGSEKTPPLIEMLQNISLVVANTQPSIDIPRPWVPNVIAAGGAHIPKERKPLPQELKEFMDNSINGVIYVSFGTVVPSEQMPDDMKFAFANGFGKMKQNVLWKFGGGSFPGIPKNVKISKWLPQHDILAHPNCLAFLTHGGLLSHTEAVYFGVPLIGVPFFGDQFINSRRAVERGFGVFLDKNNITEDSVFWALSEVVNKPTYRQNAKKYSAIFRDIPSHPADNAAFWIEHILRHKGAPHLSSEGRKLPYYQYLLLDVLAFILLIACTFVFIVYKVIKYIGKIISCKKSQKKKVTTAKKKN